MATDTDPIPQPVSEQAGDDLVADASQGHLMVHYFLGDASHAMDALVLHSCEGEILALVKDVAKQLGIDLRI